METMHIITVYGYWLASQSADYTNYLMHVNCGNGYVDDYYYNGNGLCIRPIVHLKSDIQLEKNPTTGVWQKAN